MSRFSAPSSRPAFLALIVAGLLASGPAFAADPIVPNDALTPGAIDKTVGGAEICRKIWQPQDDGPPAKGGTKTYSQAARATPQSLKEGAFKAYGIVNPHDGGASYEVDHRVPLSLGGRDVAENLWPETRTATENSAWIKDRLEGRLYLLVCPRKAGQTPLPLEAAQQAFLGDWTAAYKKYCPSWNTCKTGGEH